MNDFQLQVNPNRLNVLLTPEQRSTLNFLKEQYKAAITSKDAFVDGLEGKWTSDVAISALVIKHDGQINDTAIALASYILDCDL